MLHFCTARLNDIDAKYAAYYFVQECTIFTRLGHSKRPTKKMKNMNTVYTDLLREQHAQFRHLGALENESGGRSLRMWQTRWDNWIEIYPSARALQDVGDESEDEYTSDS